MLERLDRTYVRLWRALANGNADRDAGDVDAAALDNLALALELFELADADDRYIGGFARCTRPAMLPAGP